MEDEKKIVKVYSNNSKKARLKRNKNKFQRIWDPEKQTYIKVRKTKYPVNTKVKKKDWREIDNSTALQRRANTTKVKKLTPVQKPVVKQTVRKEPARVHAKTTTVKLYKIHGRNYSWDSNELHYKIAA